MKLDLGAGAVSPEGFLAVGRAHGTEVFPLAYPDNLADEIRASHVLEHFPHGQISAVLKDWFRVLKPGGLMKIAVPDFGKVAEAYVAGANFNAQGYVMGGQVDGSDFHQAIFDRDALRSALSASGLVLLGEWTSEIDDCAALPVSLNWSGRKPHKSQLKVRGIMSAPRLGYNDMWNCAVQCLPPLGVPLKKVGGAFWGQALTMGLESALREDDPDYILTLDYDTIFNIESAARLIQLAMVYPEAHAIAPVQASRHNGNPLFSFNAPGGTARNGDQIDVPAEFFAGDLTPVRTAHFGLTLIRADKLAALPKPWFAATANPEGRWDEGKTDDDIHFWRQWERAGNSLMLAPRVTIGHLELMVRWPGQDMRPMWQSAEDWEAQRQPPQAAWEGY